MSKEPQNNQLQKPEPLSRQGLPNSLKKVSVKDPLVSECLGAAFNSVWEVSCNKEAHDAPCLYRAVLYTCGNLTHTHTHMCPEDRSAILCPLVQGMLLSTTPMTLLLPSSPSHHLEGCKGASPAHL